MKHKHLTLSERLSIEKDLTNNLSFKAIGLSLNKDCTTISKEVKSHITFLKKGAPYRPFNDCLHRAHCHHSNDVCPSCSYPNKSKCSLCGGCFKYCSDYQKELCPLLNKPPYVCNGCSYKNRCTLEKHLYNAKHAQQEYEFHRSDSRSGINLTETELSQLNSLISPLLKKGQSLHHIITHNQDSISCCEKTLYSYVDYGLLDAINLDLPRKVRFRPRKKKSVFLKVDKSCRIYRSYNDFLLFTKQHPDLPIVQLDSLEGIKGGKVLLTIHFVRQKFQLAFLRESNNSRSVTDIFNSLYQTLGKELYMELFPILLADNGSEFSNPKALELDSEGNLRSRVFYCHPSAPYQKGACEVNHEFIRRIIPKGVDISQYSQRDINLMMNHINSYSRPELGNKAPYEMLSFYYGEEILALFDFEKIKPNDIILKPSLLNKSTRG